MLKINQIKLPLTADEGTLRFEVSKVLHLDESRISSLRITKKAVDSRKRDNIFFVYNVEVAIDGDEGAVLKRCGTRVEPVREKPFTEPVMRRSSPLRPVIIGFGPSGMFAGLVLARAGLKPLILERGAAIEQRRRDVQNFWAERRLNPESNVQFGEGGAGAFSDGKLTTGIKDPLCRKVVDELAGHGAPQEIKWSAKPHIGTDRLADVVRSVREEIVSLGGELRFGCRLTDIIIANNYIHGIRILENGREEDMETDAVLLCIGHSARDTVELLHRRGVKMMQKPFSVGARIEHPREFIDRAQYGSFAGHPALGAADYKLACHPEHGRGAYTFCMCPGGTVVNAASEEGGVVVNGMSEYARDAENSNSALLVGIEPESFGSDHPLAGIELQRRIERKAFEAGGGDYTAPAQLVGDFLCGRPSCVLGAVRPSCPTGVKLCDIRDILPKKVTDTYARALLKMDGMLCGFAMPDAVFTAAETRSSSPVRILRDEIYQSNIRGLYPCGEGAGYAGGIVSAAVDGMRCAYAVIADEKEDW